MKKHAETEFHYQISMSPVKMMLQIANDDTLRLKEKQNLIQQLSPRYSQE